MRAENPKHEHWIGQTRLVRQPVANGNALLLCTLTHTSTLWSHRLPPKFNKHLYRTSHHFHSLPKTIVAHSKDLAWRNAGHCGVRGAYSLTLVYVQAEIGTGDCD